MPVYSHSKLSSFEQCLFKYKCRYIDKIKPDFDASIEATLGKAVHETLEWLYQNVIKNNSVPPLDDVVEFYMQRWEKNFSSQAKIVSQVLSPKDYFNQGLQYVINYYIKHQPFDDGTMHLEMEIKLDLDTTGKYKMVGFIDRLAFNRKTGEYEIHDYKTGKLPPKEKFKEDRQLGLYSIAIKEIFGKDKKICLIWHYLAHDQKIESSRTQEELDELKNKIINLINKIEETTEFPPNPSILCNWCEYKSNCPAFKNPPQKNFFREKQGKLGF